VGNVRARDRGRLASSGDIETVAAHQCDLLERGAPLRPFESVHRIDGRGWGDWRDDLANGDYALRIFVGKRLKKDRVDKREDGGIGADADGEREDRDDCKTGILTDAAKSIAEILKDGIDGRQTALIAVAFLS
jgi:hypothetical protein